jgi:hypothetical protein
MDANRNVILISTILLLAIIVIIARKIFGYKAMYYSLIGFAIIVPIISLLVESRMKNDDKVLKMVLGSLFIVTPSYLFFLSVFNFFKKNGIPLWISIIFSIVGLLFFLFVIFLIKISGAGMLG